MKSNEIISFCESKGLSSFLNFSLKSNNGINSLVGMNAISFLVVNVKKFYS